MVETQLCQLRGASDTFVGRAFSIFHLQYGFVNETYDMIINTQFYQKSFARVLCFILIKDIGR